MLNLSNFSSHAVMKALARKDTSDWSEHPEVAKEIITAIEQAESEITSHEYSVTAFLPKVQIITNKESSWLGLTDARAEIYVVSLALDLSGEDDNNATKDAGGATTNVIDLKGTSAQIFEGVTRTASKKLIVKSTPIFNNIKEKDYLPLLGDGITLYGPKNPKGFLEIHCAIMEDDKGYRKLGEIIEETSRKLGINQLLENALKLDILSLGSAEIFALKSGFNLLFSGVIEALKNNKDDIIQDFHFSALAHQNYQAGIHPFTYRNANGYLKIDVENKPNNP